MGLLDEFGDDLEIDGWIDDMELENEQYLRKRREEDAIVFGDPDDMEDDLLDNDDFDEFDGEY